MKTTENRVPEPDVFYDCQEEIQNDNSISKNNKYEDSVMKCFEIWSMQGHNNPQRSGKDT